MGYRSEVVLSLNKKGVKKLKNTLARERLDPDARHEIDCLLAQPTTHLVDEKTGAELWHWQALKWYSEYPEVAFFEKFTGKKAGEENFRFMRIGEDYDDIEDYGSFDDPFQLRLERKIDFEIN